MDCPYLNELFPIDHDYSALNYELRKQAIQNSQISAIVASKWMENKVKQSPIWQGKRIYLVPFGINQDIFKPADIKLARKELGLSEDTIVLMFRSDSGSFKGLDIIKQALSKLEGTDNITIITVGSKDELEAYSDKYKILEYGWVDDDEKLANLYQACDIFLMPSRQETFGMMAIEAMSCGKMVLVLEGEGSALPEVVNSPICGLAATDNNFPYELQRLINNPGEVIERSNKSLEFAKRYYSKEPYLRIMVQIYKEVIANHHPDVSSKLVLDQLKKHMPIESQIAINKILRPENAINMLSPHDQLTATQNELTAIQNSNSWKITKPLRIIIGMLKKQIILRPENAIHMSTPQDQLTATQNELTATQNELTAIQNSNSWKITKPLRIIIGVLKKQIKRRFYD